MKKILGLTIVVLLVIGIIGGGTYALFTDDETSNGNTWTVGTLNLVDVISGTTLGSSMSINEAVPGTDNADGINDKIQFGLTDPILPGDSGTITWTLTNTGNVPGTLTLVAATTFDEGGVPNEPEMVAEGGPSAPATDPITSLSPVGLGTKLMVWVTSFDGTTTTDVIGASGVANYDPMSGLDTAMTDLLGPPVVLVAGGTMAAGGSLVYVLHWEIPDTTGNAIQGDTAQLDITFTLTQ